MTLRQKNIKIYWAWKSMKHRTQNPKCSAYKNYGARGIRVCKEWQIFEPFCKWALSDGWNKGLDLDRINNDGNCCPENCRWATRQGDVNNRRVTILITVDGVTKSCSDWAKESGIPRGSIKTWYETKGDQYVQKRIKEAIRNGYTPKDYSYSHGTQVKDAENGCIYKSINEAVRKTGISIHLIRKSLKSGKGRYIYEVLD